MNRHSRAPNWIGIVLAVVIISAITFVAGQKIHQADRSNNVPPVLPTVWISPSATRPSYCAPMPRNAEFSGTLTPTPDRLSTSISGISPTVTPRVYANVFDFSPELPLEDKSQVTVYRCNGTFDLFMAGSEVDILGKLDLGPGDVVFGSLPPASLVGHEPPEPPD